MMECINFNAPGYAELKDHFGKSIADSLVRNNNFVIPDIEDATKMIKGNKVLGFKRALNYLRTTVSSSVDDLLANMPRIIQRKGSTLYVAKGSRMEDSSAPGAKQHIETPNLSFLNAVNEKIGPIFKIKGTGKLFSSPNPETAVIAKQYMADKGLSYIPGENITKLNEDNSKAIADAYEAMNHDPNNPAVKASYEAMAKETLDQFDTIQKAGYVIELYEGPKKEPYATSEEMIQDVRDNKHQYVLSTEKDFGQEAITDTQRDESPLLKDSGRKDINGKPLLVNDVFRYVHDFFGHTERGNSFGPKGEENAWDVHSRMYTPLARRAMTTETRGQNSWVNFGPHMRNEDGTIKKIPLTERPFAKQKIGLLPEEFSAIRPVKEPLKGGAAFAKFFAKVTNTKDGGAKFDNVRQVLSKGIEGFEKELEAYLKYGRNFQKHIMASIPGFVDARIRVLKGMADVAVFLGKGGKEVNMLDITSSEGYFTKAWGQLSQDKGVNAKADALDAGVTFQRDFNEAPQVPGVNYLLQAWGDSFIDPDSGLTIPSFKATKKYEVVFEGMGFQFFSATRDKEIAEVKSMMEKNGLFVTMEKLKNKDYAKREVLKDEFKSQFFTQQEMDQKAATVLKKTDESSVGMMDYQFDRLEYEKVLANNFKYVVQIYSAGNFAGYYASDDLQVIKIALKSTGDTTTKFNEESTPKVIKGNESDFTNVDINSITQPGQDISGLAGRNEVTKLQEERETKISEVAKPGITLNLISMKQLVNSEDPIENKEKQDDIEERFTELEKILSCL